MNQNTNPSGRSNDVWFADDDLEALLDTAKPGFSPRDEGYWLLLPHDHRDPIIERAGLVQADLVQNSLCVFVRLEETDALKQLLENTGIYSPPSPDLYYLEVVEVMGHFHLYRRYQQILGSRQIGVIAPAVMDKLIDRVAQQLPALVTAALKKKGAKLATRPTLEAELALLTVSDGRIHLPAQHLQRYQTIKQMIEQAGGVYQHGGSFSFEAGFDAEDVLARLQSGEKINLKQMHQFFPTPPALARELCAAAAAGVAEPVMQPASDALAGLRVLEPEAGEGALADVAKALGAAEVICVEKWPIAAEKLRKAGHTVHEKCFLSLTPADLGLFDKVIANPPFSSGQDVAHVRHMLGFLKPGGVLSVVMSTAWLNGRQRAHAEFRELLKGYDVERVDVPAGTFRSSGTEVATVRLLIREKVGVVEQKKGQLDLLAA